MNCSTLQIGERESYEGSGGWSDGRLGQVYDLIDAIGGTLRPGSTELGCLAEALKAVELADQYIEKRKREQPNVCTHCGNDVCVEDDACRACWNEINGQFGVGA